MSPTTVSTDLLSLRRVCHDINGSLATIVSCLEYLDEQTTGDARDAVLDASGAARRIAAITAQLARVASDLASGRDRSGGGLATNARQR